MPGLENEPSIFWEERQILKEWDAFCHSLIQEAMLYDSGKPPPEPSDHACVRPREVDLFLQAAFDPACASSLHGLFEETPPLLESALRKRIASETEILQKLLRLHGGVKLPISPSPKVALRNFLKNMLLPGATAEGLQLPEQ
jgi:hypothetical protein